MVNTPMSDIRGIIFDIDGVLTFQGKTYPGAIETINHLRSEGLMMRFLTNSTLKSQRSCAAKLRNAGFEISDQEALTASFLTAAYLHTINPRSIYLMLEREGVDEFVNFLKDDEEPEFVVVGDNRSKFDFDHLNKATKLLKSGAKLIGMTSEILDTSMGDLELNVGAWVRLLELASGVEATFIGKPCPFAYSLTLQSMALEKNQVLVVGDRMNTDIFGAVEYGIRSVLVKSGEYMPGDLDGPVHPDFVIDRIDQLPETISRKPIHSV
jgi:HAD superfamily hydrolase (TIGR01458 family)